MAALCAGENTDKSGSRYVKPSLEGRFLEKFSDRAEKVLIRRVSSSNFAWLGLRKISTTYLVDFKTQISTFLKNKYIQNVLIFQIKYLFVFEIYLFSKKY